MRRLLSAARPFAVVAAAPAAAGPVIPASAAGGPSRSRLGNPHAGASSPAFRGADGERRPAGGCRVRRGRTPAGSPARPARTR